MASQLLCGLALLTAIPSIYCQSGPEIATHFKRVLSAGAGVYLPSDVNYTLETTQRWNAFSAPSYIVSVKPATDTDVSKIVSLRLTTVVVFTDTLTDQVCRST